MLTIGTSERASFMKEGSRKRMLSADGKGRDCGCNSPGVGGVKDTAWIQGKDARLENMVVFNRSRRKNKARWCLF